MSFWSFLRRRGAGERLEDGREPGPGDVLGDRYRLDALVGRGGAGLVFRAQDLQLDSVVAVKLVRREAAGPATVAGDGLRGEALAAMRLTHPHIARVHHFERYGVFDALILEFVDGADLHSRRQSHPDARLPLDEVMGFAVDLLDALDHAHGLGVIHNDLKPRNLLVGTKDALKVCDFGLAGREVVVTPTGERAVAGTVAFMSPERLSGARGDAASDLYALGATLYTLLDGRPPFGTGGDDTVRGHMEQPLPRSPHIPPHADELLREAMAKDPTQRTPSALALREAILELGYVSRHDEARGRASRRIVPLAALGLRGETMTTTSRSVVTLPPEPSPVRRATVALTTQADEAPPAPPRTAVVAVDPSPVVRVAAVTFVPAPAPQPAPVRAMEDTAAVVTWDARPVSSAPAPYVPTPSSRVARAARTRAPGAATPPALRDAVDEPTSPSHTSSAARRHDHPLGVQPNRTSEGVTADEVSAREARTVPSSSGPTADANLVAVGARDTTPRARLLSPEGARGGDSGSRARREPAPVARTLTPEPPRSAPPAPAPVPTVPPVSVPTAPAAEVVRAAPVSLDVAIGPAFRPSEAARKAARLQGGTYKESGAPVRANRAAPVVRTTEGAGRDQVGGTYKAPPGASSQRSVPTARTSPNAPASRPVVGGTYKDRPGAGDVTPAASAADGLRDRGETRRAPPERPLRADLDKLRRLQGGTYKSSEAAPRVAPAVVASVAPAGMAWVPPREVPFRGGRVRSDGVFLDVHPVTNFEFAKFVQQTGELPPSGWQGTKPPAERGDHPVVGVTLAQARRYAAWCGKRLPTTAEWVTAALAVPDSSFPWGSPCARTRCHCPHQGHSGTAAVGAHAQARSVDGVFGLLGNVWEWTERSAGASPEETERYFVMGASFKHPCLLEQGALPASEVSASAAYQYLGFRCARDVGGEVP